MATKQISLITMKTGEKVNLPEALAEGEICFTRDTGEVFIGAPNYPPIQFRSGDYPANKGQGIPPYRNIRILTELDVTKTITGDYFVQGPLFSTPLPLTDRPYTLKKFDSGVNTAIVQISFYNGSSVKGVGTVHMCIDGGNVPLTFTGYVTDGVKFSGAIEDGQLVLKATNTTNTQLTAWICGQFWDSY